MQIGIFADSHDHLDNIRLAVNQFNERKCDCVLFAGDLVSTIAVPPLRVLSCPMVGCFGNNEGNKLGILAGLSIVATVFQEPPIRYQSDDGTRFVIAHMERELRKTDDDFDVAVYGHTHKSRVGRDGKGRLHINPGETSGWSFGTASIAILDTDTFEVDIIELSSAG